MSRSSPSGVALALGATAAVGLGAALLKDKEGSSSTYGVRPEDKGAWTYAATKRWMQKVRDRKRGRPLGAVYKRMVEVPGGFVVRISGRDIVKIRKDGLFDLYPQPTMNWGERAAMNKYSPAYVQRRDSVDWIASGGIPPKVPTRWEWRSTQRGRGEYDVIPGWRNPGVVEIPLLSITTVDGGGSVVHQQGHRHPPSAKQRRKLSVAFAALSSMMFSEQRRPIRMLDSISLMSRAGGGYPNALVLRAVPHDVPEVNKALSPKKKGGSWCPQCAPNRVAAEPGRPRTPTEEEIREVLEGLVWDQWSATALRLVWCDYLFWETTAGLERAPWPPISTDSPPRRTPNFSSWSDRWREGQRIRGRVVRRKRAPQYVLPEEFASACDVVEELMELDLKRYAQWRKTIDADVMAYAGLTSKEFIELRTAQWAAKWGHEPPFSPPHTLRQAMGRYLTNYRDLFLRYMWTYGVPSRSIRILKRRKQTW
ncbi:hypothetical protein CMI47_09400 [Candidatus Pacearchaeota archaeon]|nr:hypothetical protein [Candidatus Pacearchaeota archaeon]